MLDLGCGDCATLAPILSGLALKNYTGFDLSETALAFADKTLSHLNCPVTLVHGHLLEGLAEDTKYDVIYCSFALHHLPTREKADFFDLAARRLTGRGLLLLVDIVRADGETLGQFHQNYCDWLRRCWSGLNPSEQQSACAHVMANVLPESEAVLMAQAEAAGLRAAHRTIRHDWHQVLCFVSVMVQAGGR